MDDVIEYCKDNLPLFIPLLVLTTLFTVFLIFLICRQFKKSIVASAARSLYNITSSPVGVTNQSNSTNRTSIKRPRGVSEESEHGFEMISSSPTHRFRSFATPARSSRRTSKSNLSSQGPATMANYYGSSNFEPYPESSDSTMSTADPNFVSYENELPISVYRLSQKRCQRRSGNTLRRHPGGQRGRTRYPLSHPSTQVESNFLRFQPDDQGNYPDCLVDNFLRVPMPIPGSDYSGMRHAGSLHTFHPRRTTSISDAYATGHRLNYDPTQMGAVVGQNEFGLTPVMEEMGSTNLVSGNGSLQNTGGAQQITGEVAHTEAPPGYAQVQHPFVVPNMGRGIVGAYRRDHMLNVNRYSTPLPPGHRPLMYRVNSKTSSGINSIATNQSARTYYTNHNDLAHSISSISLNSTLDFYDESDVRGMYNASRTANRPYSSDSELDAMPGSRRSFSQAIHMHPVAIGSPYEGQGSRLPELPIGSNTFQRRRSMGVSNICMNKNLSPDVFRAQDCQITQPIAVKNNDTGNTGEEVWKRVETEFGKKRGNAEAENAPVAAVVTPVDDEDNHHWV